MPRDVSPKTVYLILAHADSDHYHQLIGTLADGINDVFVHVDSKVSDAPFRSSLPGVRVLTSRVPIKWGGWSIVDATLQLMRAARPSVNDDDYVVLISGDTYPLQSPAAIRDFLASAGSRQYINSVPFPSIDAGKPIERVSRFFLEHDARDGKLHPLAGLVKMARIPANYKRAFAGRKPYCGSQWWALTGSAIGWLLDEVARDRRYQKFAHHTAIPDEYFFQTLIMASPFSNDVSRTLMFTDFEREGIPLPAPIDDEHIERLRISNLAVSFKAYGVGPVLFARKVRSGKHPVAKQIEEKLWPLSINAPFG